MSPTSKSLIAFRNSGAALVVWLYALVFATLFTSFLFYSMLKKTPASEAFYIHNLDRIQRFGEEIAKGRTGIVLVGDSRLRYATHPDEQLSDLIAARVDRPVAVLIITNNWATFDDFAGLLHAIGDSGADLVILQEDLFARERARPAQLLLGRAHMVWRLLGRGPWNPGNVDQPSLQSERRCAALATETIEQRRERVGKWVRYDPNGASAQAARAFADEQYRFRLEILSIPRSTVALEMLPGFERPEWLRPLHTPLTISDDLFCDVVHLNANGRRVFSDWLAGAVAHRL